jgi:hypothetical protein
MHWDGYWDGVGDWLCHQLKLLLAKYTPEQAQEMVEALEMKELAFMEGQAFKTEDLIPFLEGKKEYKNDACDDIQYQYTLNFKAGTLIGENVNVETRALMLSQIHAGMMFSSMDTEDPKSVKSVDMILSMFALLSDEDKSYVRTKLT